MQGRKHCFTYICMYVRGLFHQQTRVGEKIHPPGCRRICYGPVPNASLPSGSGTTPSDLAAACFCFCDYYGVTDKSGPGNTYIMSKRIIEDVEHTPYLYINKVHMYIHNLYIPLVAACNRANAVPLRTNPPPPPLRTPPGENLIFNFFFLFFPSYYLGGVVGWRLCQTFPHHTTN